MSRIQPIFSFLRPLGAPRAPAYRSFSAATRLHVQAPATPKANPTAPKSPKAASRAADLAEAEAATEADSAQAAAPKPVLPSDHSQSKPAKSRDSPKSSTSKASPPKKLRLPAAKYLVGRSASNNYPLYTDYKRGGNLHITTIRKITGDLTQLRDELKVFLGKKDNEVRINQLTQHVVVKGHHVPEITEFLKARGM